MAKANATIILRTQIRRSPPRPIPSLTVTQPTSKRWTPRTSSLTALAEEALTSHSARLPRRCPRPPCAVRDLGVRDAEEFWIRWIIT